MGQPYDLVIRGGTVATATDVFAADVAVTDGRIAAIGNNLAPGRTHFDATGRLVLPGGVDAHTHIEQMSSGGFMNADTFETATSAAVLGGTTTVISFAAQGTGQSLARVVEDYHLRARAGAVADYAFHMILGAPTEEILRDELPDLVRSGHSSLKLFMTYDRVRLDDEAILDVLTAARESTALVMAHAENHGMIKWLTRRLLARGYRDARYHAVAHARSAEKEAFGRIIALAELIDQPIMLYHVSTAEGAAVVREARGRGLKVYGETCPQYLFFTRHDLGRDRGEAAKFVFSPPAREVTDAAALWQALTTGDLQLVSSDHAPYAMNDSGKFRFSDDPDFPQVISGAPGIGLRMPLMFDAMVSSGRFPLTDFVRWSATEPARIYGLGSRKGNITIGADADIVLWNPKTTVTVTDTTIPDGSAYTPYAGRVITGWPETVLRRGEIVAQGGRVSASAGSGQFLPRDAGPAARPLGRDAAEFDTARNFGALLR